MKTVNFKRLNNASGATITDLALSNGVAVYSETLDISKNIGYMSILATEEKAGGGGDVDISAEYSLDGSNFYTAYTSSAGALTAESLIVEALQNVTRWIVLPAPRLAKYMRFKLDPDADSQITLDMAYQEEY